MTKNMAASVHQRLLNIAKVERRRFNDMLQHYTLERWLYRLSVSAHADRFILKGARVPDTDHLPAGSRSLATTQGSTMDR